MLIQSSLGVEVVVHDLAGQGQPLLISHATGFHGRCYVPLAKRLSTRFHSYAIDYRGHGDSALPAGSSDQPIDWRRYGDDAEVAAKALKTSFAAPLIGFGHSMGGTSLLLAAHRDPTLFDLLVVFEPIVMPPLDRPSAPGQDVATSGSPLASAARRRRARFPSFEAALANYRSKPPLASFTPEALEAYVRHGFDEHDDGQVHLKCRPETEAATFESSYLSGAWDLLGEIRVPVVVVAGKPAESQPSAIAGLVADQLPRGTYLQLDDLDHFGPMTDPDLVADLIAAHTIGHNDAGAGRTPRTPFVD